MRGAWLPSLASVLLAGCMATSTDSTDPANSANVNGTWRATFNAIENGQPITFRQVYVLTQSGANVTGAVDDDPHQQNTTPGSLTATLSGTTFTAHAFGTASPYDDCAKYPYDFVATVSGNTMTVKSGSGYNCDGDSHGGHTSLTPVTLSSGTITRLQ